MEELLALREEIVENLAREERPVSLQAELLDEVYRIDKELVVGGVALFAVNRNMYHPPAPYVADENFSTRKQSETLF